MVFDVLVQSRCDKRATKRSQAAKGQVALEPTDADPATVARARWWTPPAASVPSECMWTRPGTAPRKSMVSPTACGRSCSETPVWRTCCHRGAQPASGINQSASPEAGDAKRAEWPFRVEPGWSSAGEVTAMKGRQRSGLRMTCRQRSRSVPLGGLPAFAL
jgi:hypothetical protein